MLPVAICPPWHEYEQRQKMGAQTQSFLVEWLFCPLRLQMEAVFCASALTSPAAEHAATQFIITQANLDAAQGRRSVSRPKGPKVRLAVIGRDRLWLERKCDEQIAISAEIYQGDHADGNSKLLSVRKQNCCHYYANVSLSRGAKENDLCVKSDRITAGVIEGGKYYQLQTF